MRLASDSFEALIWSKLYSVWPFALAISVHFVTELNRNIRRPKQFRLLVYLPACILTYIQFSTQLIALPPIEKYWGWSIQYKMGPINNIAMVAAVTYWLTILTTLLLYNKKLTGKPKKQSKIIFIGFLFFFITTLLTDIIFPQFHLNIPEFGNIFGIITFLLIGYGIWRYDIFIISHDSISSKLFSSISNYLILVDENKRILEINHKLLDLLQYTHEQVVGQKLNYLLENSLQEKNPLNQDTTTSAEFTNEKILFKNKHGIAVKLTFSASLIKIDNSTKTGLVYIGTDERLNILHQQSFEENKRHTRFLAEAALDMFLFKRKEDVYHYVTEHIYNLLNKEAIVTCAEFNNKGKENQWEIKSITGINTKFRDLIKLLGFDPLNLKSTSLKDYDGKIEEGKLTRLELDFEKLTNGLISNKTGNKLKKLLSIKDVNFISKHHGKYIFGTILILTKPTAPKVNHELIESFMAIASLVLNRQNTEIELSKSEKLFRSIVENSQASIFIIDTNGEIILAEGEEMNKLGMSPQEIKGNSIYKLAKNNTFILEAVKSALNGEIFTTLLSYKKYHFNITFTPFYNDKKEFIGTLGMVNDITNRVNSEIKLKELSEMQTKLISIIGHDLRSSISNVISFSDIILTDLNTFPKNKIQEFINLIKRSANNGNVILGGLIEWHKTVQNKSSVQFEHFRLKETAAEAIEQVILLADKKNISITNNVKESISIFADKNMILTVLRNLLSNSVKFTNQQGEITIQTTSNTDIVKIFVTDNGIGMTEKQLNSLFDFMNIFVGQGTAGEAGSGLGLQICKDLVERNNGTISVESTIYKGSTFTITIPIRKNPELKETNKDLSDKEIFMN